MERAYSFKVLGVTVTGDCVMGEKHSLFHCEGPTTPLLPQEAEMVETAPETHGQLLPLRECADLWVTGVVFRLHQHREGGNAQSGESRREDHLGHPSRHRDCVHLPLHAPSEKHPQGPSTTSTSPFSTNELWEKI